MKSRMRLLFSVLMCFTILIPMSTANVQAATTITSNQTGTHDGYNYELWKDSGNTSMTLNSGGAFSCQWSNIINALFRKGKKFDETKTHQQTGNISVNDSANYQPSSNSNWMINVEDNKHLSQISIPGTHDSAALHEPISGTAKCQDLTLEQQFNIGVRYIDIRCKTSNGTFEIYHGYAYQYLNFDEVIKKCTDFLNNNPTETIIMSVKNENASSENPNKFEEIFNSYVEKNKELWLLTDTIPTLGEARGKIVLIRRFTTKNIHMGIDASDWKDNTTFTINNLAKLNIQDSYKVNNNETKWSNIINLYSLSKEGNDNVLYLNYTSGYKSTWGIPNINSVRNYINPKLVDYFNTNTKGRFGISVMDFVDEKISTAIISTNFN